ncbi:MAG: glycosyltransferase, partial [Actinobacteria bacterium]|nr:glycosyltransferase [Actinomycetota bacterium]
DGSRDDTSARGLEAGARVIRSGKSRGKGAALRAGLARTDAAIVVFIDADLGASAAIARSLATAVATGEADMAVAAPPPSGASGFGIVERLARSVVWHATGAAPARPLSGQRAMRRAVLDRCVIAERFGVEVALSIDAARAGFRILEVPLELTHDKTGRDVSGFVHRARQGIDVLVVAAPRLLRSSRYLPAPRAKQR